MSAVGRVQTLTGQPGRVDGSAGVQGDALVGLRSTTGAALIAPTVLASAVGTLDANVVKVAVPAIGRGLHADVGALQWTLTGYLLTVAALLLLTGALADRFGRRRVRADRSGYTAPRAKRTWTVCCARCRSMKP